MEAQHTSQWTFDSVCLWDSQQQPYPQTLFRVLLWQLLFLRSQQEDNQYAVTPSFSCLTTSRSETTVLRIGSQFTSYILYISSQIYITRQKLCLHFTKFIIKRESIFIPFNSTTKPLNLRSNFVFRKIFPLPISSKNYLYLNHF